MRKHPKSANSSIHRGPALTKLGARNQNTSFSRLIEQTAVRYERQCRELIRRIAFPVLERAVTNLDWVRFNASGYWLEEDKRFDTQAELIRQAIGKELWPHELGAVMEFLDRAGTLRAENPRRDAAWLTCAALETFGPD